MSQEEIRLVDLWSERKEAVLEEILEEFRKTFRKSQYVLGEPVGEFESAYAKIAGCRYGIGLNSGTDAIYLSLRALGIGPGDEVITVPNSFVATVGAISVIGAKPVLVDVGEDHNIDPTKIEPAITEKTKAVLIAHLAGNPCKMDEILAITKKHNLKLIEDAAQSIGAEYKGKRIGSFGDTGCFSLHPLKNLHVWGDGGMITTNDEHLANELKKQRNHGLINRDAVEFFSFNSRLDTLQAIVGLKSIPLLEETMKRRAHHAAIYDERLATLEPKHLQRPEHDRTHAKHVYHLYVILAEDRDALREHLLKEGIETKIHYPIPIHLQEAAKPLGYQQGDFPTTESLAQKMVSIPIRENLTDSQVHRVCDAIEAFYR